MAARRSNAILMAGEGFEITLRDVYIRVTDISSQLGILSSNLQRTEDKIEDGIKQRADHEIRIRTLEKTPIPVTDWEVRIRSLERFKYLLLGALILINGSVVVIEYFLSRR